jgi:hypothetical protein
MAGWRSTLLLLVLLTLLPARAAEPQRGGYLLGSYYFPGWSANQRGSQFKDPWARIQPFPEREPRQGWYSDADPAVLRRQAQEMRSAGLGFVVFDSYWDREGPFMDHALRAYAKVWRDGDPRYALMWANHFRWDSGRAGIEAMLDSWMRAYLVQPGYLRIDGRPALFVFSIEHFDSNARELGMPIEALVELVQQRARRAGLPGVYLIAGTAALEHWVRGVAPRAGFSALTAYNYHIGYSGSAASASAAPKRFADLAAAYLQNWRWIVGNSALPYIVPMTAGWDRTPWLDSAKGEGTYRAIATPEEFEAHLRDARKLMDEHAGKTLRMGIICCWNEYGEGSFIEPTRVHGSSVLDKIQQVFEP